MCSLIYTSFIIATPVTVIFSFQIFKVGIHKYFLFAQFFFLGVLSALFFQIIDAYNVLRVFSGTISWVKSMSILG